MWVLAILPPAPIGTNHTFAKRYLFSSATPNRPHIFKLKVLRLTYPGKQKEVISYLDPHLAVRLPRFHTYLPAFLLLSLACIFSAVPKVSVCVHQAHSWPSHMASVVCSGLRKAS